MYIFFIHYKKAIPFIASQNIMEIPFIGSQNKMEIPFIGSLNETEIPFVESLSKMVIHLEVPLEMFNALIG